MLIDKHELNAKAEFVFGVKNLAQRRTNYEKNTKTGKPDKYQIIDSITSKLESLIGLDLEEEKMMQDIILETQLDDNFDFPDKYYKQLYNNT